MKTASILIVDDEYAHGKSLQLRLELENYQVSFVSSLVEAKRTLNGKFDIVLLDWMLGDGEGIDLLKGMNQQNIDTPVILLTAKDGLSCKEEAFEHGAWDYIVKPFEVEEVLLRIKNILKRTLKEKQSVVKYRDIVFDQTSKTILKDNKIVTLTSKEYQLCAYFLTNVGTLVSRDDLINAIWGLDSELLPNTINSHIKNLRKKLDLEGLETVRHSGYRLHP